MGILEALQMDGQHQQAGGRWATAMHEKAAYVILSCASSVYVYLTLQEQRSNAAASRGRTREGSLHDGRPQHVSSISTLTGAGKNENDSIGDSASTNGHGWPAQNEYLKIKHLVHNYS